MATSTRPSGPPIIRMYNVGFGDCFLLTIPYRAAQGGNRHVLIDFGSFPKPKGAPKDLMERIARDIQQHCAGGRLAVVATHRHADHISGFATNNDGTASGDIIASLKPEVVVQPWTEHPRAARTAQRPAFAARGAELYKALQAVELYAEAFVAQLDHLPRFLPADVTRQLRFIGEDVISNKSAVKNLMTMGRRKARYVHAGSKSGLEAFLPGVNIHVLGPPTLDEAPELKSYADKSPDYWLRRRQITLGMHTARGGRTATSLFAPAHRRSPAHAAAHATWFIERLRRAYADELLGIVTVLDDFLNNTSLILLFEVRGHKLLFPGDAQLENWDFALRKYAKLLRGVTVYKVGHHGSLNATPRRLWSLLTDAHTAAATAALTTLLSTKAGVHGGKRGRPTEVPRRPLVDALEDAGRLVTTLDRKDFGKAQVVRL